jgi:hypothetical protein
MKWDTTDPLLLQQNSTIIIIGPTHFEKKKVCIPKKKKTYIIHQLVQGEKIKQIKKEQKDTKQPFYI